MSPLIGALCARPTPPGGRAFFFGAGRDAPQPKPFLAATGCRIRGRLPYCVSRMVVLMIVTGAFGTSWNIEKRPVGTARILSMTSIPSITLPKTA